MIISPCFSSSVLPPPPSRRCPACPGCSVSCSQQRANSSGTWVGPRPQYPVEAKEARQRSLLCRSIGVWQSMAKTHTRSEHAAHLYGKGTQAGERPILHRVAKGKIPLPLHLLALLPPPQTVRHSASVASTSLKAQCDKMRYATAMPQPKRQGEKEMRGRAQKQEGGLMKIPDILDRTTPKGDGTFDTS